LDIIRVPNAGMTACRIVCAAAADMSGPIWG
jgi:hypothetical protein